MAENIPTYPDLDGKVALVTGGSGGIGAVTSFLLAANGAKVAVHGRELRRTVAHAGLRDSDYGVRRNTPMTTQCREKAT
jgi:NAD(P)-dependent dehydrogenase (short-subunit alcohol dehydrogenase family)